MSSVTTRADHRMIIDAVTPRPTPAPPGRDIVNHKFKLAGTAGVLGRDSDSETLTSRTVAPPSHDAAPV